MKRKILTCIIMIVLSLTLFLAVSCASGSNADIGGTNVQELGVDEGDIAKYVGNYIYKLQKDGVTVSETLSDGSLRLISSYPISDVSPEELYISDNRLIAILSYSRIENLNERKRGCVKIFSLDGIEADYSFSKSLVFSLDFKGVYLDSRIVISKGQMLLCYGTKNTEDFKNYESGSEFVSYKDTVLEYEIDGQSYTLDEIEKLKNIPEYLQSEDVTVYATIDLSGDSYDFKLKATEGFPFQTLYVSEYGFYTAYSYVQYITNSRGCGSSVREITHTMIAKIDGATLSLTAQKFFDGMNLISRHAIKDNGKNVNLAMIDTYYRAVTVISLDEKLSLVGYQSDICQNESLKSVSFSEEDDKLYCYIVTYQEHINLDPLFKVDVTDPENMIVTGLLSIDGFSSYTYNFDGGLTVGIGEDGNGGIKVSLFDVSNDNPTEINSIIIANAVSEATSDSKAFCVLRSKKIFAIPVIETCGDNVYTERMYFYKINESGLLEELGYSGNRDVFYSSESFDFKDGSTFIRRAFYGENYIYTVCDDYVYSYSFENVLNKNFEPTCVLKTKI